MFPASPATCRLADLQETPHLWVWGWCSEKLPKVQPRSCIVEMQRRYHPGDELRPEENRRWEGARHTNSLFAFTPSCSESEFLRAQPIWRRTQSQANPPTESPAVSVRHHAGPHVASRPSLPCFPPPHSLCPACASQIKHQHFHPCLKPYFLDSLGYDRSAFGFYVLLS